MFWKKLGWRWDRRFQTGFTGSDHSTSIQLIPVRNRILGLNRVSELSVTKSYYCDMCNLKINLGAHLWPLLTYYPAFFASTIPKILSHWSWPNRYQLERTPISDARGWWSFWSTVVYDVYLELLDTRYFKMIGHSLYGWPYLSISHQKKGKRVFCLIVTRHVSKPSESS